MSVKSAALRSFYIKVIEVKVLEVATVLQLENVAMDCT